LNKSVYGGSGVKSLSEVVNFTEEKTRKLAELIKSTQDTEKAYAIWTNPDFTEEQEEENMKEFEINLAIAEEEKAKVKAEEAAETERIEKEIDEAEAEAEEIVFPEQELVTPKLEIRQALGLELDIERDKQEAEDEKLAEELVF
jgi:hypothetical protein